MKPLTTLPPARPDRLKTFSTSEVRTDMARLFIEAQHQPVIIRYHRRDTVVMLSMEEFQRLQALDRSPVP